MRFVIIKTFIKKIFALTHMAIPLYIEVLQYLTFIRSDICYPSNMCIFTCMPLHLGMAK